MLVKGCGKCVKCVSSLCLVYQVCVNSLKCVSRGVEFVSSVCQGNGLEDGRLDGQSPGG